MENRDQDVIQRVKYLEEQLAQFSLVISISEAKLNHKLENRVQGMELRRSGSIGTDDGGYRQVAMVFVALT